MKIIKITIKETALVLLSTSTDNTSQALIFWKWGKCWGTLRLSQCSPDISSIFTVFPAISLISRINMRFLEVLTIECISDRSSCSGRRSGSVVTTGKEEVLRDTEVLRDAESVFGVWEQDVGGLRL